MSQKKSDYPKTYRHPATKQERNAANVSQEVNLKFDGYRLVEAKAEESVESGAKAEAPASDTASETPAPAPKATAPKPGPTTKAQEGK